MKHLLKFLFLSVFALTLAFSCSDDDDNNKTKDFTIIAEGIHYNVIEVSWTPIEGAYSYQEFYQKEGSSEWLEGNYHMANPDNEGEIIEIPRLSPSSKYTIYVKAYKDSQRNVLAISNKVEATTLDVTE